MGATYLMFICSFSWAEGINLFSILVNAVLAYWIVRTIQNKLTNKRILKDHFINEVKEVRNDYSYFLSLLYQDKSHPRQIIPWFKLMTIKTTNLMEIINAQYSKIDKQVLSPYQNELRELITNNEDFIKQYNFEEKGNTISFSEPSKSSIIMFQQNHSKLFNNLIIQINNA